MQTAVEWLIDKLMKGEFINSTNELIEQAKEMEKQQTEISDEEIEKGALRYSDNLQQHIGWDKAIEWYREQLKQKQ